MTFRFKLEGVLRFRKSVEESEEAALYRIVRDIAEAERELQELENTQLRFREQRERLLAQTLPGVHLREIAERELELKTLADGLRSRLRQLETQRLQQLVIYQTAHQDREILSELREQQRRADQTEHRRREQKALDDLFLIRGKDRH
jgi:flagellar export protein FliJ